MWNQTWHTKLCVNKTNLKKKQKLKQNKIRKKEEKKIHKSGYNCLQIQGTNQIHFLDFGNQIFKTDFFQKTLFSTLNFKMFTNMCK